jgi:hypothetical protein
MNQIKEELNVKEASCREIVISELQFTLRGEPYKYMSWGSRNPTVDDMKIPKMFRLRVSGHHHKGYVYIFLNGLDLFDVYLTNLKNVIKKRTNEMGIYVDQLVEWIDTNVERIPEYID